MNNKQSGVYTMLRRVLAFLKRNLLLFTGLTVMDDLMGDLETYLGEIETLKEQQGTDIRGLSKQKATIRLTAIKKALEVSRAIQVYAKVSGNQVLAAEINYTLTDLKTCSDNELDTALGVILRSAQNNQLLLAGYGVTPLKVTGLKAAIDALKEVMGSPKEGTIARKQVTERIIALFDLENGVLEKMDLLMETLKDANPALYAEYQDNRRVQSYAGSLSLRMSITDAATTQGIAGVEVTFMLDGAVELQKTSADAGGISVKSLDQGAYVLTLCKIGYKTQTLTANVTNGDLNVVQVAMERVVALKNMQV